ncbi:MAG: universal stress protein [Meiothermus sp.]|uniref:universal stress protein n=1 Tax=Meiothermus sp. TaxID=1955249 RepID=UPI0025DC6DC5|nr:universal stress protein [Meiothermus sp.]MCS7068410.1 universal stress protein [Meiothermus sp.]MCX7600548.1 universal stress protein [Meiothermus sp.]MDW8426514.1 universal stress protein [Meiothermus sp.]
MFKKILIPTDGSEFGQDALEQGLDLAKMSGGEVTILYAIENPYEPFKSYATQPPEYFEQLMNDHKATAQKVLSRICAKAQSKGVRTRTVIVEEHPVPAILEAAQDHDLVVMATHGRKGIDRVMMGSVTDKVLHNCSTPVLVVRGAAG